MIVFILGIYPEAVCAMDSFPAHSELSAPGENQVCYQQRLWKSRHPQVQSPFAQSDCRARCRFKYLSSPMITLLFQISLMFFASFRRHSWVSCVWSARIPAIHKLRHCCRRRRPMGTTRPTGNRGHHESISRVLFSVCRNADRCDSGVQ